MIAQGVNILTNLNRWASCFDWNHATFKDIQSRKARDGFQAKQATVEEILQFVTYMRSLTDGVQRPFGPTTAYISNSLFRLKAEKEKDLDEVIRAPKQAEVNADDQIDNVIPPSPDTRRGWAYQLH